jgi:RHS repeat-associated protein
MAGLSSKAVNRLENKRKWNAGTELNSDFDINLYETFYRSLDPQTGRFLQPDPKATENESLFASMGNNPIFNIDPNGDYFFGLFGSTSEQRHAARAFATETGGEVHHIASKNVSVSYAKIINENNGDVAVGETGFYEDGFAKVYGSEAHQVFKNQSYAMEHGFGRIDPRSGEFQYIPASGRVEMVDDPITILGPGLLKGLFGKLATAAATSLTTEAVVAEGGTGAYYSVAYEMKLASTSYPGVYRGAHFLEANKALSATMATDARFASTMSDLGVTIPKSPAGSILGKSPTNWVWHHDISTGVMQLVPKTQHTIGSLFWDTLHPGGVGGFSIWGK